MVLQHEYQHNETILQTLQLKEECRIVRRVPIQRGKRRATGGWFGSAAAALSAQTTGATPFQRAPVAPADVAPFSVDVYPVTNGDFLEFIREGGYARRSLVGCGLELACHRER
jgi:iron(II)-dependent oxidoreductase